jgi:hypothetical protein
MSMASLWYAWLVDLSAQGRAGDKGDGCGQHASEYCYVHGVSSCYTSFGDCAFFASSPATWQEHARTVM